MNRSSSYHIALSATAGTGRHFNARLESLDFACQT